MEVFKMSNKKLDYEIEALNQTLGTNLAYNRTQSGYKLYENDNFGHVINSALTYQEFLKAIQTIRYCFESKPIKKLFYTKLLHTLY